MAGLGSKGERGRRWRGWDWGGKGGGGIIGFGKEKGREKDGKSKSRIGSSKGKKTGMSKIIPLGKLRGKAKAKPRGIEGLENVELGSAAARAVLESGYGYGVGATPTGTARGTVGGFAPETSAPSPPFAPAPYAPATASSRALGSSPRTAPSNANNPPRPPAPRPAPAAETRRGRTEMSGAIRGNERISAVSGASGEEWMTVVGSAEQLELAREKEREREERGRERGKERLDR